jgi:hypothetical protein
MLYREREGYSQDDLLDKAPDINNHDFVSGDGLNPEYEDYDITDNAPRLWGAIFIGAFVYMFVVIPNIWLAYV